MSSQSTTTMMVRSAACDGVHLQCFIVCIAFNTWQGFQISVQVVLGLADGDLSACRTCCTSADVLLLCFLHQQFVH
jgi:hypothetical protein